MSESLMVKCLHRADGVECVGGYLYNPVDGALLTVENNGIPCPCCEGKGMLLTSAGRELLKFLQTFPVNTE